MRRKRHERKFGRALARQTYYRQLFVDVVINGMPVVPLIGLPVIVSKFVREDLENLATEHLVAAERATSEEALRLARKLVDYTECIEEDTIPIGPAFRRAQEHIPTLGRTDLGSTTVNCGMVREDLADPEEYADPTFRHSARDPRA